MGLSDREVADYSLDAHMLDLEAVVKRLGIERFDLFAPTRTAPAGIAYAARHPDRVSHLILWNAGARWTRASVPNKVQVAGTLASQDWEMFLETFARVMVALRRSKKTKLNHVSLVLKSNFPYETPR